MSSLDARLTFRFNIFFLMEIPRRSSPLMLLAPLPRIQLFLFFLAVPAYDISLPPFILDFSTTLYHFPLEYLFSRTNKKTSHTLGIFDNKKTDNEFFFLTISYANFRFFTPFSTTTNENMSSSLNRHTLCLELITVSSLT